ncbi:type II secretion system minor pseudopilin GspI [Alteromonas sp. C1M14]|uniref:type II secretion system minor pseudopilin GspI n=1 Tax=Alteromonas sp. C1M14 TaxID=2841567 RepID=UPI001C08B00A|nr:type II secretion system minor pseudopilin GspI [Alteromonas sp. C1M14]
MILSPTKQSGLTLLEVMAAIVIFALAGTAALKAASDHLLSVGKIEETTFATWVANNRINQVKLTGSWPPQNNVRGTTEMADRTWYWQQAVQKTANEELRSLEISVGLDGDYNAFTTTVVTFVAEPASVADTDDDSANDADDLNDDDDDEDDNS